MITDINSEDRLVQQTFAEHLEKVLGWESVYAYNAETFGPNGTLGCISERDVVLVRDLRAALVRLNPDLPASAAREGVVQPASGENDPPGGPRFDDLDPGRGLDTPPQSGAPGGGVAGAGDHRGCSLNGHGWCLKIVDTFRTRIVGRTRTSSREGLTEC